MRKLKTLGMNLVNGEAPEYSGKDADAIFAGINNAGARGAEWTGPIELSNGVIITFVLRNIVAFYYEFEDGDSE
jgi:hypothetical protein